MYIEVELLATGPYRIEPTEMPVVDRITDAEAFNAYVMMGSAACIFDLVTDAICMRM